MKSIDWYMGLKDELDTEFQPLVDMFDYFDDMILPRWSLPTDFTNVVKHVMAVVDTGPSDAVKSGAIAFSRNQPIFSVSPFSSDVAEYDRAQKLEDNIGYHFKRANKRGNGSVMYDMAESSLRYGTVCVRVDDLAHILPKDKSKWTSLQRSAWGHGRFLPIVHSPKKVRYTYSNLGLTFVAHDELLRVTDALAHWKLYEGNNTDEGKMIAQAIADIEKAVDDNKKDFNLRDLYVLQTYAIDHDKVCIWGSLTDKNGGAIIQKGQGYEFVFADQENPYGFINWSIRVAGNRLDDDIQYRVSPMLAPLYWSKSWDKLNLYKSVVFSEPFRRARAPRGVSITMDGEGATIDHENGGDVNLRTGEDYKGLQPITLDEGAVAVISALEGAMNRTVGASMIGDVTKIDSRTAFSTFSAMIKVALSRLDRENEIISDSAQDIACQFAYWAHKTNVPLISYAETDKQMRSGQMLARGSVLEAGKDDYDINHLGISCRVNPSTPTDRMEQLNMAIMLSEKLNMPSSELLQQMGYENVGLSYKLWVDEFLKKAELQAQAQGMIAKATAEAQASVQQGMQAPPQPQGTEGQGNASFGALGGTEGFNPAFGGTPPANAAPSMTREAITGQTMNEGM